MHLDVGYLACVLPVYTSICKLFLIKMVQQAIPEVSRIDILVAGLLADSAVCAGSAVERSTCAEI